VEGQYFVLQPGSSVATSLSGGEAVEKKVVIMEIMGDQYRTVPVTLHTTRPFVIAEVKLADELDSLDVTAQQVEDYLAEKITDLIASVKRQSKRRHAYGAARVFLRRATDGWLLLVPSDDPRYSNADRPDLPLIRLRVDHTGFPRVTNVNKCQMRVSCSGSSACLSWHATHMHVRIVVFVCV